jgi:sRNA-binding protein
MTIKKDKAFTKLASIFPQTFFVRSTDRKPLKIGIDKDLADAGIMVPRYLLKAYCNTYGYLKNCRAEVPRINLDGAADGTVTGAEAVYATKKYFQRKAQR